MKQPHAYMCLQLILAKISSRLSIVPAGKSRLNIYDYWRRQGSYLDMDTRDLILMIYFKFSLSS